jgi:hypothetical protein
MVNGGWAADAAALWGDSPLTCIFRDLGSVA